MKLFLALMLLPSMAFSQRLLTSCDKSFAVQTITVTSTPQRFFSVPSTGITDRAKVTCFTNLDSTLGNFVYVSSFSQSSTSLGYAIPGAYTERCFKFGALLKYFLFTASGSRSVTAITCE